MAYVIYVANILSDSPFSDAVTSRMVTTSERKMKQFIVDKIYNGTLTFGEQSTHKQQSDDFKQAFDLAMRPVALPDLKMLNARLHGAHIDCFRDGYEQVVNDTKEPDQKEAGQTETVESIQRIVLNPEQCDVRIYDMDKTPALLYEGKMDAIPAQYLNRAVLSTDLGDRSASVITIQI